MAETLHGPQAPRLLAMESQLPRLVHLTIHGTQAIRPDL